MRRIFPITLESSFFSRGLALGRKREHPGATPRWSRRARRQCDMPGLGLYERSPGCVVTCGRGRARRRRLSATHFLTMASGASSAAPAAAIDGEEADRTQVAGRDDGLVEVAIEEEEEACDVTCAELMVSGTVPPDDIEQWKSTSLRDPQGNIHNKHTLIKALDLGGTAMSMDRTSRVKGTLRHSRHRDESLSGDNVLLRGYAYGLDDDNAEDSGIDRHHSGDTFAVLVSAKEGSGSNSPRRSFMMIAEAHHFATTGAPLEHYISTDETQFHMSLDILRMDSYSTAHNDEALQTTSHVLLQLKNVSSVCAEPISPSFEVNTSARLSETGDPIVHRIFRMKELKTVFELLVDRGNAHKLQQLSPIKVDNKNIFVVERPERPVCNICDPSVAIGRETDEPSEHERALRNHTAHHIIEKEGMPAIYCAWCGGPDCSVELIKQGSRVYSVRGKCTRHKFPIFFLSSCKASKKYPSTQRPIECAICKEIHWSYNIASHYQLKHPNGNADDIKKYLPSDKEKDELQKIFLRDK